MPTRSAAFTFRTRVEQVLLAYEQPGVFFVSGDNMQHMSKSLCLFVLLCLPCFVRAEQPTAIDGFSAKSLQSQLTIEKRLTEGISPARIEDHLKWLTSRPHRTGTDGAKITADYILQELKKYGFKTEMVRYDMYLPAPVSVSIELTKPAPEKIPTTEDRIEGDPFTEFVDQNPGWNGYSPSGEATAPLVYAHHGSDEDFLALRTLGVEVKGKILLMRYFGTGEGRKIHNAQEAGAAAVVLYSDPQEDGYPYGLVYPDGDWRPPGGIMRRSIVISDGDPLSPGWAAKPGAKRLSANEVELPRIPVLPISYRSAQHLLSLLTGPVAPYSWQGALGLTYRVGPGPAEVHVRTQMDNRDRPTWNVIGRLPGSATPEEWVTLGNHHDAWIFGAGDPSSGTAALLTLAEQLGKLAKAGLRPKRTLIITFWDAEEMLLGGSTEWVEEHQQELLDKLVACINMDSAVFNTDRPLSVSAHPVLHNIFRNASRSIRDPRTGRSLFETWRDMQNVYKSVPGVDGWGEFFDPAQELKEPYVFESPSDDAGPFIDRALPASDMYYGADYGMYHSIYENFHWMKTIVDPTFEYHKLMALLQGFVALRIANADLVPLDYATEAGYWKRALQKANVKNPEAYNLINHWQEEATGLLEDQQRLLSRGGNKFKPRANHAVVLISRDFFTPGKGDKNLFYGISDFDKNSAIYMGALKKRVESLQAARKLISE